MVPIKNASHDSAASNPKLKETPNTGGGVKGDKNSADPVDILSGEAMIEEIDVQIACPVLDLNLIRAYHSNLNTSRPFGHRWTHNYDWSISLYKNEGRDGQPGDWVLLRAVCDPWLGSYKGGFHWFMKMEDGSYINTTDIGYRLYPNPDNTWRVNIPGGINYLFDTNGVLTNIAHVAGQSLAMHYEGEFPDHLLTRVQHSNGKFIEFQYGSDQDLSGWDLDYWTCVTNIVTPSPNLSVSFIYNDFGDLRKATRHTTRGDFTTEYFNRYEIVPMP